MFKKVIILLIWLGLSVQLSGQILPNNVCRVEGDRIVFRINTGWSSDEFAALMKNFDLDSTLIPYIKGKANGAIPDSLGWDIKIMKNGWLEISQALNDSNDNTLQVFSNFFLMDDQLFPPNSFKPDLIKYGVNKLKNEDLIIQNNDLVTIRLNEYPDAEKVFISGSFNGWAVDGIQLTKDENGWRTTLPLNPGKYLYKYIVDGNWTTDPNNSQTEKDFEYNENSVLFVYNTHLVLKGFPKARKVYLAGSFNDFKPKDLPLTSHSTTGDWTIDLYLNEGTYYYKFVVDREWILDPSNPDVRSDGKGNENSVLGIGDPHVFFLPGFTDKKEVILTGSFNDWNTSEIYLQKGETGWTTAYVLGPGTFTYKYIVDGVWMPDPGNTQQYGSRDYTNSVLTIKPNIEFKLEGFPDAKTVWLTGSFIDWKPDGYRMQRIDGVWSMPLHLEPGKYTYKFVVDGKWILDPANELYEENQYGTDNSVIWIE